MWRVHGKTHGGDLSHVHAQKRNGKRRRDCQIDAPSQRGYSTLRLTALGNLGWGQLLGFTNDTCSLPTPRAALHTVKSGDTSLSGPFEP